MDGDHLFAWFEAHLERRHGRALDVGLRGPRLLLVTGGGSGIGSATALHLAGLGFAVTGLVHHEPERGCSWGHPWTLPFGWPPGCCDG